MKLKVYVFLIISIITIKEIAGENSDGTNSFKSFVSEKKENSINLRNDIVKRQIPSPVRLVMDITYDGENLWVAGWQEKYVYKISPIDGSIIDTIPINGNSTPRGMTFIGNNLYIIDSENRTISKVDTSNGDTIYTFEAPCSSTDNDPAGLAWDGKNLWQTENFGKDIFYIYKMDTLGNVLSKLPQNGGASGLTFAYNSLWKTDNSADILIEVEMDGFTEVKKFSAPGGNYPNGLTFDGEYLWLANADLDLIYQLDVNITSNDNLKYNKKYYPIILFQSNNKLKLDFQQNQLNDPVSFEVYNTLGQKILSRNNVDKNIVVDLKNISDGTYFYKLLSKKIIVDVGKIIK